VRIIAPIGARATFYPEPGRVQAYDVPTTVSVRPGYLYRFRLADLPQGKDVILCPTLEVIGTLKLPNKLSANLYPVPVVITEDDIERVLAGAFITKLIVLEDPDRALPIASKADEPLETTVPPDRNLLEEAWTMGRPMLILRLGQRQATHEELGSQAIPGTMLLPDDKFLNAAPVPPRVPYHCFPVTDPKHGLRWREEEVIKDGGDVAPAVGFDAEGKLRGLDAKDTVAEYVDDCGRRRITVSNRVCILVPRYAVIRTEIAPSGMAHLLGPSHTRRVEAELMLHTQEGTLLTEQAAGPEVVRNTDRPVQMQEAQTTVTFDQLLTTGLVIGQASGQMVVGTSAKKCEPPGKPLYLCKSVDRTMANIGDVVTFTLEYSNPGGQPINDVVVSDSLTGRLEYVRGSYQADREAVFTLQANEAGSSILRWELSGRLLPGEQGVITFQARIR